MDIQLKDFVRETIVQIVAGVKEAQEHPDTKGAIISPKSIEPTTEKHHKILGFLYPHNAASTYRPMVHLMNFDVAVSASNKTDSGGKVGVSVLSISADFGGGSEGSHTSQSRIQFGVPIVLPTSEEMI